MPLALKRRTANSIKWVASSNTFARHLVNKKGTRKVPCGFLHASLVRVFFRLKRPKPTFEVRLAKIQGFIKFLFNFCRREAVFLLAACHRGSGPVARLPDHLAARCHWWTLRLEVEARLNSTAGM